MSWNRPFDQPVPLPNGGPARTLRDAANYIKKLPKSERDCPECLSSIPIKAKRCMYCTADVPPVTPPEPVPSD